MSGDTKPNGPSIEELRARLSQACQDLTEIFEQVPDQVDLLRMYLRVHETILRSMYGDDWRRRSDGLPF